MQTFVFAAAKTQRIHVTSSNGPGVERGGNHDDGGVREGQAGLKTSGVV